MKSSGIINPHVAAAVAGVGHTQSIVIADAGLPLPKDVNVIDLSLTLGSPSFEEVLNVLSKELVIESYVYAKEMEKENVEELQKLKEILGYAANSQVTHEKLKEMLSDAYTIIRTGECSKYCNVILIAGAGF